jgi:hypothetical protein
VKKVLLHLLVPPIQIKGQEGKNVQMEVDEELEVSIHAYCFRFD